MKTVDLIIKNARIVDGSGAPGFLGSVGICDSKICFVTRDSGEVEPEAEIIDAQGHVLAPGFIDIHTHSDFLLLRDSLVLSKLRQGITTQVIGQCGLSPAPITDERIELLNQYSGFIKAGADVAWTWRSFADWLNVLEKLELGTNIATMVGQGTIKIAVMGFEDRNPTDCEIRQMCDWVREAMAAGAFGMSTGLVYPPGVYASTDEICAVAAPLREFQGVYATHMRNESHAVVEALDEAIDIATRNGISAQISHHKALGRKNWGRVRQTLQRVEEACTRGVDLAVDLYPYTACSTTLRAMLPPWANEGGITAIIDRLANPQTRQKIMQEIQTTDDWENFYLGAGGAAGVIVMDTPSTPQYQGRTLVEISEMMGKAPLEAAFELISLNHGCDNACYDVICEDDIQYVMRHPLSMIASDSIPPAPGGQCHPRTNGTFPRVLAKYVRETGTITLEEAVRKMSSFPASRLGLQTKGLIRPGMDADLVIFDPDTVADQASFENPHQEPVGIDYVFVNGQKIFEYGRHTGQRTGKLLRK